MALKKSDRNFFPKWPTAAILDFGKCRKTIAHNGKVHAMFPENFKAIGPGVQELSSGNAELLQYTTKMPIFQENGIWRPSWISENAEKQ